MATRKVKLQNVAENMLFEYLCISKLFMIMMIGETLYQLLRYTIRDLRQMKYGWFVLYLQMVGENGQNVKLLFLSRKVVLSR